MSKQRNYNNSRVVPVATENLKLQPQANPVNKEIKYQPQVEDAARLSATAQGLAKLGQGLVDINPIVDRKAQENIIAAEAQLEEKNKQDWAKVSKKVTGMAKFNPYNKRAYNQILAGQMAQKYYLDMQNPDYLNLTADEYRAKCDEAINNLSAEYQQSGIHQGDFIVPLENFAHKLEQLKLVQNNKAQERQFEMTNSALQNNYSLLMNTVPDGVPFEEHFTNTMNAIVEAGEQLGLSDVTNATNVLGMLSKAIYYNPSEYNASKILGQLRGFTVNGKPIEDLIPDFDGTVLKMVMDAKHADLQERKLDYETQQFNQKMARNAAMDEWTELLKKGDNLSPDEVQQWAVEAVNKYGLDGENSIALFNDLATGKKTFTQLKEVVSDPELKAQLTAGVIDGTTTRDEIAEAVREHRLNPIDGANIQRDLMTNEQKQQTAEAKRVKEHLKAVTEEYLTDNKQTKVRAVLRTTDGRAYLSKRMHELESQYEMDHNYQKFNEELAYAKNAAKEIERRKANGEVTGFLADVGDIALQTPEISQAQWSRIDVAKSTRALNRMKLLKNSNGLAYRVNVASAPSPDRNGQRHTGYDLDFYQFHMGQAVYAPQQGKVVAVLKGDNGGMGNTVLIRCSNGNYIKYMHLQNAELPSLGEDVTEDTVIGHIGNSGYVENKNAGSLHVEFYDSNHNWITAYQFGM